MICVNVLLVLLDVLKMKIVSNFIYYMLDLLNEYQTYPLF